MGKEREREDREGKRKEGKGRKGWEKHSRNKFLVSALNIMEHNIAVNDSDTLRRRDVKLNCSLISLRVCAECSA